MASGDPLVHLTTVVGSVAGRLVVGRLRAEGIAATMSGLSDGPYPFPAEIDVLVPAGELAAAREILLAQAVDATFGDTKRVAPARRRRQRRHRAKGSSAE
jgi:hypothetical protein